MGTDRILHSKNNNFILGSSHAVFEKAHIEHEHYCRYFDHLIAKMQELVAEGHEIVWGKTENWCSINGKTFNVPKDVWEIRNDPNYVKRNLPVVSYGYCESKLSTKPLTVIEMVKEIIELKPHMKNRRSYLFNMPKAKLEEIYNDAVSLQ